MTLRTTRPLAEQLWDTVLETEMVRAGFTHMPKAPMDDETWLTWSTALHLASQQFSTALAIHEGWITKE